MLDSLEIVTIVVIVIWVILLLAMISQFISGYLKSRPQREKKPPIQTENTISSTSSDRKGRLSKIIEKSPQNESTPPRFFFILVCILASITFFLPYISFNIGIVFSLLSLGNIGYESLTYTTSLFSFFRMLTAFESISNALQFVVIIPMVYFVFLIVVMWASENPYRKAFKVGFYVYIAIWLIMTFLPIIIMYLFTNLADFNAFFGGSHLNDEGFINLIMIFSPIFFNLFSYEIAVYYGLFVIVVWFLLLKTKWVKDKKKAILANYHKLTSVNYEYKKIQTIHEVKKMRRDGILNKKEYDDMVLELSEKLNIDQSYFLEDKGKNENEH